MYEQITANVSKKGEDKVILIPRKHRDKFNIGDDVVIIKSPPLKFVPATELVKT